MKCRHCEKTLPDENKTPYCSNYCRDVDGEDEESTWGCTIKRILRQIAKHEEEQDDKDICTR